jgi:hypothetical protein
VAVPAASGADDNWVGMAFLANRGDAEMGSCRDCIGSTRVSDSCLGSATMAVQEFTVVR